MDAVAVLVAAVMFAVAFLLIGAGIALTIERRNDDPHYTPRHTARAVESELERAVNDSRRRLRRSPAPWSQPAKRHSDGSITKPAEEKL